MLCDVELASNFPHRELPNDPFPVFPCASLSWPLSLSPSLPVPGHALPAQAGFSTHPKSSGLTALKSFDGWIALLLSIASITASVLFFRTYHTCKTNKIAIVCLSINTPSASSLPIWYMIMNIDYNSYHYTLLKLRNQFKLKYLPLYLY